jgi:catechol 2,3-dioxygenase-like lactoylglutathione lyase family enzyme
MPSLTGVLETAIYVDDLDRASRFYEELFTLTRIEGDERFRAYSVGGRSVLLLFKRGASNHVTQLPFGKMGPARVGRATRRKEDCNREPCSLAPRRNQPLFS